MGPLEHLDLLDQRFQHPPHLLYPPGFDLLPQVAQRALAALALRSHLARAQPDVIYCMEISDGEVVMETQRAEAAKR